MTTLRTPDFTVTFTREQIPVYSNLPEPDPDWRFTDSNEHEHYRGEHEWPTLVWAIDEVYWCTDCEDEHEDGHWACAICGEEIRPGTRAPSPYPHYIPGLMSGEVATVNGRVYTLTREDFERFQSTPREDWASLVDALPDSQLVSWRV